MSLKYKIEGLLIDFVISKRKKSLVDDHVDDVAVVVVGLVLG